MKEWIKHMAAMAFGFIIIGGHAYMATKGAVALLNYESDRDTRIKSGN